MTERVDVLIERVMKAFPGVSTSAQARYYEEVHQELAPLAREIERQRDEFEEQRDAAWAEMRKVRVALGANMEESTADEAERIKQQRDELLKDADAAFTLLATMFDAYEDGDECYEDPEDHAGYCGKAIKLDEADFDAIVILLNKHRPRNADDSAIAKVTP